MSVAGKKLNTNSSTSSIYWVSFEDYLKPKNFPKKQPLLLGKQKAQLRLKLLEHPVLVAAHKSKYTLLKERLLRNIPKILSKVSYGRLKICRFLSFLYARNDNGNACKRKSGFEIYCELASIHGFGNFVGASTLQRAFWFLVVLMAVIMSGVVLLASHVMTAKTPTILYAENALHRSWEIPFPAVTICNLNRISKLKAENLAKTFQKATNLTIDTLTNYFKLALFSTEHIKADATEYNSLNTILNIHNFTMLQLLHEIAPSCDKDLLKCSVLGNIMRCGYLFKPIETSFGQCCSFNYRAVNESPGTKNTTQLIYASKYGDINGLSVLLDPRLNDYKASSILTPGFRILIHHTNDFADGSNEGQHIITTATFNKIRFWPYQTYATEHISSLDINTRKCYLRNEREMFYFGEYSQRNCLAECHALMFFEKCNCALPHRPRMQNWTMCGLADAPCYFKYKYLMLSTVKHFNSLHHKEQFVCNCYPLCNFNIYDVDMESGQLSRKYSLTGKQFFKGVNITDPILLKVFVRELNMERLRLDVSENWLSFLGTFGGITSLYMGYSILSGFELIFFVLVRPVCNWWTKKRIEKRLKQRIPQQ